MRCACYDSAVVFCTSEFSDVLMMRMRRANMALTKVEFELVVTLASTRLPD